MPDDLTPDTPDAPAAAQLDDDADPDDGRQSYPTETVRKLRKESAGYRERARTAEARVTELETSTEALQRQVFALKVGATGRLASAEDLPFDAALVDDDEALTAVIDGLLEAKPHFAQRRAGGAVGQGERGGTAGPASFADLLR